MSESNSKTDTWFKRTSDTEVLSVTVDLWFIVVFMICIYIAWTLYHHPLSSVLILDAWRSSFHFPNPESECWSKKIFWKRIRQNYNGQMCIKPNPVRRTDLPVLPANTRIDSFYRTKNIGGQRLTSGTQIQKRAYLSKAVFLDSYELPFELTHIIFAILYRPYMENII